MGAMDSTAVRSAPTWSDCIDPVHRDDFLRWVVTRDPAPSPHLLGVDAVASCADGLPTVRRSPASGVPLPDALEGIGTPTAGTAVTLTLPLVELLLTCRSRGIMLGEVRPDDVLVDTSGSVVVVDTPPGTTMDKAAGADSPGTGTGTGTQGVLLACRLVWERVDPRTSCRPAIDAAIAAARADPDAGLAALEAAVRTAAPPRPVWWAVPSLLPIAGAPEGALDRAGGGSEEGSGPVTRLLGLVRAGVELGVVLPVVGRIPANRLLTVVVVIVGLAVGLAVGLHGPSPSTNGSGGVTSW